MGKTFAIFLIIIFFPYWNILDFSGYYFSYVTITSPLEIGSEFLFRYKYPNYFCNYKNTSTIKIEVPSICYIKPSSSTLTGKKSQSNGLFSTNTFHYIAWLTEKSIIVDSIGRNISNCFRDGNNKYKEESENLFVFFLEEHTK